MTDQIIFEPEFATNPEPRCPCLLLLDVSGSMNGRPIAELNAGLQAFRSELQEDSLAAKRVEVGIVTFGPVKEELPFHSVVCFFPPELSPQGDTPMGNAILKAIQMVEERKNSYKSSGIEYYRPWIFMITDGSPTDDWQQAAMAIREGEESKKFAFFAVGVEGANMATLQQISVRTPLKLDGLKFRELFQWLSNSMRTVSHSSPQTEVLALPAPSGWAAI